MPVTEDIMKHEIIGPAYRQAFEEGLKEVREAAWREGYKAGYKEGMLAILRLQLVRRFGPIPTWLEERLTQNQASDLLEFSDRFLDAQSLDDLK